MNDSLKQSFPKSEAVRRVSGTAEEGSVAEAGDDLAIDFEHVDDAFLDEVHTRAQCALLHDQVARLEHLEAQLRHHVAHELGVRICEKRHRRHQRPAVEVDHLLHTHIHTSTFLLQYIFSTSNFQCDTLKSRTTKPYADSTLMRIDEIANKALHSTHLT